MNQINKQSLHPNNEELIEKLEQVDEILASFEDWMHGKDGDNCTKARILLIEVMEEMNKPLPDHYEGQLNTDRITTYLKLEEQYNLQTGTIRDIFCKGADWYKEQCQKTKLRN